MSSAPKFSSTAAGTESPKVERRDAPPSPLATNYQFEMGIRAGRAYAAQERGESAEVKSTPRVEVKAGPSDADLVRKHLGLDAHEVFGRSDCARMRLNLSPQDAGEIAERWDNAAEMLRERVAAEGRTPTHEEGRALEIVNNVVQMLHRRYQSSGPGAARPGFAVYGGSSSRAEVTPETTRILGPDQTFEQWGRANYPAHFDGGILELAREIGIGGAFRALGVGPQ